MKTSGKNRARKPLAIAFTYEKITPESAEQGDVSERGWYGPGGWFFPLDYNNLTSNDTKEDWKPGNLRHAIKSARDLGIREPSESPKIVNRGAWFSSVDPDEDYRTGESTYYALHVEGASVATLNRIARALRGEQIFGKGKSRG